MNNKYRYEFKFPSGKSLTVTAENIYNATDLAVSLEPDNAVWEKGYEVTYLGEDEGILTVEQLIEFLMKVEKRHGGQTPVVHVNAEYTIFEGLDVQVHFPNGKPRIEFGGLDE